MSDNVNYTGAPAPRQNLNVSINYGVNSTPDEFGASFFSAVHGLGETGEQAALKKQELANNLLHDQLALDTSKQFSNAWSDFGKLEGDAAVAGLKSYQARLKQIYDKAIESAPNDAVKRQLAQTMFRDADRYMSHGANYADTQWRHWHDKLHTDAIENNGNQVLLNRKQSLGDIEDIVEEGSNGVGGADSVREKIKHKLGSDADLNDPAIRAAIEGEVAKYRSTVLIPAIEALALEGDVAGANKLFQFYKDRMDATGAKKIEAFLKPKVDDEWVMDQANQHKPIPGEGFPTDAADQRRLAVGRAAPTRQAAAALGGQQAPAAGARHPSDFFTKLERGDAGLDYINKHDSQGSHSYGSLGLNSLGGASSSASRFAKENPHLGLEGAPGSMQFDRSWEKAAHEHPDELRAAERRWWEEKYLTPVSGKLKAAGVPDSIANNRLVQLYMADRNVQQGEVIIDKHASRMHDAAQRANNDPNKFLDIVRAQDVEHLGKDFATSLDTGAYSATGHQNRLNGRMAAAQQALAAETGAPAAGAQPAQPQDSVLSPGYTGRQAHREDNLVKAHALAGGDPVRERKLYNEFNRRDILLKENLSGERNLIDATMKDFDLRASKGIPGLTLESTGLTEERIRAAHKDKPWVAEHIIESFRLQAANADKLSSMKFAPKEDWDAYLRDASNGIGIDAAIKTHREKSGTTSAFDLGANPEAQGEIMSNDFAIKEKVAATARRAYSDHMQEIQKDPAGYLITYQNPAVMKAKQAVDAVSNDPAKRELAFREYASRLRTAQLQMGVPEDKVRVLTNARAEETVGDIMKSENPKRYMETLKATYGGEFQPIFNDLVKQGKLPPKFEALMDLDNQDANLLAGRIKAEASEKGNEHRQQMETLLGDKRGKIAKAVRDNETTKDWMLSMAYRQVSDPQRADVHNTVNMLAEARVLELGEDVSTAADNAVKAFTKNIKFTKDHVAIPADKYEAVMAEASDHLRFLDADNVVVPHAIKELGHDNKWYTELVQSTRSWKATPDGDGMYLVDHFGNPVIVNNNGKPDVVKVEFDRPKRSLSAYNPIYNFPGALIEAIGD